MPRLPHPVKLRPRYLPKPWGGRRMETVLGRALPPDDPIGECWLVHDRDGASSVVEGGPLHGTSLTELRGGAPFPLLVKLLDAGAPLSVQVHPDEEAAERLGAEPKTECWFVLQAEPGARVHRGLVDGCTREDLERALAVGDIESCLHSFLVRPGDTVFIPAGTIHTIGAGVLLAEVQQNSDTTYRLHDWGRLGLDGKPRELHLGAALESIRFGPRSPDTVPTQEIEDHGTVRRLLLIRCRQFGAEHVTATGTATLELPPGDDDSWRVLHVLSGEGKLRAFDRAAPATDLAPGDTLLLPGADDAFELELGAHVLRAMVFTS